MVRAVFSIRSIVASVAVPSSTLSIRSFNTLSPTRHGVHLPQLCVAHMPTNAAVNSTGHGASELTARRRPMASCRSSMTTCASLLSMTCSLAIDPPIKTFNMTSRLQTAVLETI